MVMSVSSALRYFTAVLSNGKSDTAMHMNRIPRKTSGVIDVLLGFGVIMSTEVSKRSRVFRASGDTSIVHIEPTNPRYAIVCGGD